MHRILLTSALTFAACLLPSCRITDKGVDVSMVRDRVMPAEQDQVYVESGSDAGAPDAAPASVPYGYNINTAGSYTVQPGDTLSKIAARHQVSLAELYRANNLTGTSMIKVGQRLVIPQHSTAHQPTSAASSSPPAAAGHPTTAAAHASAPSVTSGRTYTIQAGDTLSSIARRLGVSMQAIMQANNLSGEQASRLRIGQRLRIPSHP